MNKNVRKNWNKYIIYLLEDMFRYVHVQTNYVLICGRITFSLQSKAEHSKILLLFDKLQSKFGFILSTADV